MVAVESGLLRYSRLVQRELALEKIGRRIVADGDKEACCRNSLFFIGFHVAIERP